MAVVAFTGTATGKVYEVGKTYTNSKGEQRVANADGSFTNPKTGKKTVGSSQSSTAKFYHSSSPSKSGSSSSGKSGGGGVAKVTQGAPAVSAATAAAAYGGGGTGPGAVAVGTSTTSMLRVGAFGGPVVADLPPAGVGKITMTAVGGWPLPRDPGTSDAQAIEDAYGEPDFWNPIAGIAMTGMNIANIKYGVDREVQKFGQMYVDGWNKDVVANAVKNYNHNLETDIDQMRKQMRDARPN